MSESKKPSAPLGMLCGLPIMVTDRLPGLEPKDIVLVSSNEWMRQVVRDALTRALEEAGKNVKNGAPLTVGEDGS